jgi:hypothetical protein
LLAASLYQGNPDRNHNFWNTLSEASTFQFVIFSKNFLVSNDDEGKVFIFVFYEISDFPESTLQSETWHDKSL